jgi:acyl-CoA thioester hydrolase
MSIKHISVEIKLKPEFYDVDSLKIVWHGHYVKYLEKARSALMAAIGYNYLEMEESGFAWPIVTLSLKYVKPIYFGQEIIVRADLIEHEHRIKIGYEMTDARSGELLNKAETVQMGIDVKKGTSILVSPVCLTNAVSAYLNKDKE